MKQVRSETIVWRFLDGRPGHENQTIGLADAVARQISCTSFDVLVPREKRGMRFVVSSDFRRLRDLPVPDLMIGAGHATHVPLLAARARYGGFSTVIMKPTLPTALFDLCFIPVHDEVRSGRRNVILIEGALNRMRPSVSQDRSKGLILVGGPSRHFRWSNEKVIERIQTILQNSLQSWSIVSSERTPPDFESLCRARIPNAELITPVDRSRSWLPDQMAQASAVWVTCDSMSMMYESLTCGASLGLIELEPLNHGRIVRNVSRLIILGLAVCWSDWMEGLPLPAGRRPLCEAERCAALILNRLDARRIPDSDASLDPHASFVARAG
ncbi:MAG: mitochondrial fission ELM1 family protein [Planctomyces sp.]|nr:mitochondrial fission ELM1 family protein [Planctomyces sp.]